MKGNELVIVQNDELYVGTWDLSQGFEVEHRMLTRFVKRYEKDFEDFGFIATQRQRMTEKKGQQIHEYLLTEEQSTFLVTLLKNSPKILKFKKHLTKEFYKQKRLLNKLIVQKQNAEWLEKRSTGKLERRIETDAIQAFIEYARSQGSQNAAKYYMAITKMENNALFHLDLLEIEYDNLRDIVNGFGLDSLKMADHIVARALKEGMSERMYYKDIFKRAKARVESFADSIGKMAIETDHIKAIK